MQPLDAERVKEWRHRRMLSQQEVADRAGTSLFTIQRIERGEGNVRPKTGRGVADALGVPVEELLPKVQAPLFEELPRRIYPAEWRDHAERLLHVVASEDLEAILASDPVLADQLTQLHGLMDRFYAEKVPEYAERRPSMLAKAVAVAAERWASITESGADDPGQALGIVTVASDLISLLGTVMEDEEFEQVWEKVPNQEKGEITNVIAALRQVTGGYCTRREEDRGVEQQRAMMRQLTRELEQTA